MIVRRKKLLAAWDRGYRNARDGKGAPSRRAERSVSSSIVLLWAERAGAEVGRDAFNDYCRRVATTAQVDVATVADGVVSERAVKA